MIKLHSSLFKKKVEEKAPAAEGGMGRKANFFEKKRFVGYERNDDEDSE